MSRFILYKRYIKSDAWKMRRAVWFQKHGKYCRACGRTSGPIHLHHVDYSRLGRELDTDFIPLCATCHREFTTAWKRAGRQPDLRTATIAYVKKKRTARKAQNRR